MRDGSFIQGFHNNAVRWTPTSCTGQASTDVIFAVNDRKAIGAMIALKNKNIRIGKEMGVVGFTNDPLSTIISPSLTTIAEPAFDMEQKL
jgi:DNA-binding LacI/PurR family transcriptional regulator